ncbi:uncharacterized protein LOC109861887 [Pseudomyrmex gracilis]|uniref:uncharacterized protein LOC109861887 n=1 Tax=Pseudomyrmex gracilis TaxID=219809 RepID=UPI000995DC55|nr:uncharacterized protein LOC109861887 [Pseudomyrmex gracilis]
MFTRTHVRDVDGRFIVRLPFRDNKNKLGESQITAEKRLLYLEQQFRSNELFKKLYMKFMREYINLNHVTVVPITTTNYAVYLLHHGVWRDSAVSTRLRVVFDASCKTSSGLSLNDTEMVGATLQDPIINIILQFRIHSVVITADLQKM